MRTKFFLALFTASMFFLSCSDDDVPVDPVDPVDENYHAKEFFSKSINEKLLQTITFNTTELPKTFTLTGGTKITIEDGTFAIGGIAVTGSLTLEVIECLKPSAIVYSGTNTNYIDGRLFVSDGFLFINAKQGDEDVDKNLLKNMDIEIPTDKTDGEWTQLWEGVDTAGSDNDQFAWDNLSDDVFVDNQAGGMEIMAKDGYFPFKLGKLGWFNCDIFWDDVNPKTTLFVKFTGNPIDLASYQGETGYTCVFFHGYGDLVVAQLYTLDSNNRVKSYDDSMPVGKTGKLFAFTVKEGKFYLAEQEITIAENMEVTLDMTETTEAAIQAVIDALD